jgi:hypothetical protein
VGIRADMASTITLIAQDDEAYEILDEFEERTGLEPEETDDDETRVYAIEGEDHRIEIIETLDEIDDTWPEHLALGSPA